jgi:hypothetical protein
MSIANTVQATIEFYESGNVESALIMACIAVDATAKKEYPTERNNNVRYKGFMREYAWLIGHIGLRGVVARHIKLKALPPNLKPDSNGSVSLEDVLYGVVRCGLLHEATIKDHVILEETVILGYDGQKYQLPTSLPLGLIAAAIASPLNISERLETHHVLKLGEQEYFVNDLWGRRDVFAALLYR